MSHKEELIKCVEISDRLKRQVTVASIITKALEPLEILPIVVGGSAVEFYTLGQYATMDIDFVGIVNDDMKQVMTELGFEKEGRYWRIPETDIMVEFPSESLVGAIDKVQPVEIEGKEAYYIGVEDLIINRVQEAEHWKDLNSAEWARNLMVSYYDDLDWSYCHKKANEFRCMKKFEEIQRLAKQIRKQMTDK